MPSMIESLIGEGIKRTDNKRIIPTRRPLPGRPRELFELFVALGAQATATSLMEVCDLRQADPRHITYIALSRWPTEDELAEQPTPYAPRAHLRSLLLDREFRDSLVRRICDAYPERQRLLYVRIPRCAGEHFTAMANDMHAIIPRGLPIWRPGDQIRFFPALGNYLGRFNATRTIQIAQPRLYPFIQTSSPRDGFDTALPWYMNPPPKRPGDRLFTIVREPTTLLLSQVNAILAGLQLPQAQDTQLITPWRIRFAELPPNDDTAGWQAVGRQVIMRMTDANPICTALGEGTAVTALAAARLADLEIADLSLYADWVKYTWDVEPEPPANTAPKILTEQDLDAPSAAQLRTLLAEDLVFYGHVKTQLAQLGELKTAVRGRDL